MKRARASLVWRLTPVIVALRKLKQEVVESLSSAQPWLHSRLHLKTNKQRTRHGIEEAEVLRFLSMDFLGGGRGLRQCFSV